MTPIDVAVIGCGRMGSLHARTVAADARCRLVAVIDVDEPKGRALAQRLGASFARTVPLGVGAVVVATPTHTHGALVREHLNAGRFVLAEKPLVGALHQAAGLDHSRLMVGYIERFNPAVRALGSIRPMAFRSRRNTIANGRNRDINAGLDVLIHDLDLALWWGNGPVEVQDGAVTEDEAWIHLQVGNLQADLYATRSGSRVGRDASLTLPEGEATLDFAAGRAWLNNVELPRPDLRDGLAAQWDAFVDAILGLGPIPTGYADAIRTIAIVEQLSAAPTHAARHAGLG